MSIRRELEGALEELEIDLCPDDSMSAQTCIWRGAALPCVPTRNARTVEVDADGNEVIVDLSLIIRRSHFLNVSASEPTADSDTPTADQSVPLPVSGRLIEFPRGTTYRVITVTLSPDQSYVRLALADPGSGR